MMNIGEIVDKCRNAFRNAFSEEAATAHDPPVIIPANTNERVLVNYLWINKDKSVLNLKKPQCAISMSHVQCAVVNANKYPEADIQIWVDKKILDDYSLFLLQSFIEEKSKHKNVTVCDLQSIPDYANDCYFVPLEPTEKGYLNDAYSRVCLRNAYSRADYARILVLDHCLQVNAERPYIIYSDMDCKDLRLPEAKKVMQRYGIVIHDFGGGHASHGYIGLLPGDGKIEKHFPSLKSQAFDCAHQGSLGVRAFDNFLEAIGMPNKQWFEIIGLPDLLPAVGVHPRSVKYTPPPEKMNAWKLAQSKPANASY